MDIIKARTRLRRIGYMLREKGLPYTWNYLFLAATYNNDFIRDILLTKFYPRFVFFPRYIEVEVTTRCNLRCTMCEHTYWREQAVDMTLEQFRRVVDQFPKLSWIGTTGIGSSFLNRDFPKMLQYAKSRSIYVELFDPFHMLSEGLIEAIVGEGLLDRLICSMDGATRTTYEKIRVGARFDRVVGNIRALVESKRRRGTSFPELSFHYIISRDNFLEVPRFVQLVHDLTGGDNIGIMFSHLLHDFQEIQEMVVELPEEIRRDAEAMAKKYRIKLTWGKNARQQKQPIQKCTEWTMPFIFADGSVIPCCAGNEANRRDFQVKHSMGNIYEEPFEEIWTGRLNSLREAIHRGKVPVICKDCPGYDVGF